jgi:hypothetical protein
MSQRRPTWFQAVVHAGVLRASLVHAGVVHAGLFGVVLGWLPGHGTGRRSGSAVLPVHRRDQQIAARNGLSDGDRDSGGFSRPGHQPLAVTEEDSPAGHGPRALLGFLSANTAVVGAVMFYMGWVYTSAWLGHFRINPLDLDIGITEYALRGLNVFSPVIIVIGAIVLLFLTPAMNRAPDPGARRTQKRYQRAGAVITVAGVLGYFIASSLAVPTYLLLALLGLGPLMIARRPHPTSQGRWAYALALIMAALSGLWATALYASAKGAAAARETARDLPNHTAAVIYSVRRLSISGPGVRAETLPKGGVYGFRYTGLRLLIARNDRYYLLPVGWTENLDATYVLHDGDALRVELYAGTR